MPNLPLTTSYCADTGEPILETTVGGALRAAAERAPDRVALIAGEADPARRRQWSYGELLTAAERGARSLAALFEPGERVAVWAGNCPEWVQLEFAAALAGLTLVPVNPAYQAEELAHVLGIPGPAPSSSPTSTADRPCPRSWPRRDGLPNCRGSSGWARMETDSPKAKRVGGPAGRPAQRGADTARPRAPPVVPRPRH